jgi:hypothetical protein
VENNSAALAHYRLADQKQRVHPEPRDRSACMQAKTCINAFAAETEATSWTSGKRTAANPFEIQRSSCSKTQKQATILALSTHHGVRNTPPATLRKWLILSCD